VVWGLSIRFGAWSDLNFKRLLAPQVTYNLTSEKRHTVLEHTDEVDDESANLPCSAGRHLVLEH
jgi:hypothetical protein